MKKTSLLILVLATFGLTQLSWADRQGALDGVTAPTEASASASVSTEQEAKGSAKAEVKKPKTNSSESMQGEMEFWKRNMDGVFSNTAEGRTRLSGGYGMIDQGKDKDGDIEEDRPVGSGFLGEVAIMADGKAAPLGKITMHAGGTALLFLDGEIDLTDHALGECKKEDKVCVMLQSDLSGQLNWKSDAGSSTDKTTTNLKAGVYVVPKIALEKGGTKFIASIGAGAQAGFGSVRNPDKCNMATSSDDDDAEDIDRDQTISDATLGDLADTIQAANEDSGLCKDDKEIGGIRMVGTVSLELTHRTEDGQWYAYIKGLASPQAVAAGALKPDGWEGGIEGAAGYESLDPNSFFNVGGGLFGKMGSEQGNEYPGVLGARFHLNMGSSAESKALLDAHRKAQREKVEQQKQASGDEFGSAGTSE